MPEPSGPPGSNSTPPEGGQSQRPDQAGPSASVRPSRSPMGWIVLLLLGLAFVLIFQTLSPGHESITWDQFQTLYKEGALDKVVLTDTSIVAERQSAIENDRKDAPKRVAVEINPRAHEAWVDRVDGLTNGDFTSKSPSQWPLLLPYVLMSVVILVIFWFIFRGLRSAGGAGGMLGSFGKSRHRVLMKDATGVTFSDVAGVDESKEELAEIVEFLKHPKKFMRLGGRIPRGVLLYGSPGCGKTLLAKAIAGEADVPFFSISGSDFVEMFVGVGASRVRDLFKQAKENAPCIIFLDEIDAVGRRRGGGFSSGGHDEREQTLNAILVEMDGFETSDQVIVIASTNRPDVLDPALTRPGRFDRHVQVSLPDVKGRMEILQVHAKKVKLGPDVDLERVARGTPMFSGADLAAIVNEAAIIATLADKDFVEQADLEEARDKVKYGRQHKSKVIEEKERIATAYHEAGHAVLQALLPDADPLHKVTIIPRGNALGATFSLPEKDRYGFGLKWINATMRIVCGGRIAELRKTDDVSSGAAMDISQLTNLARSMVLDWGMSEKLGFVRYSSEDEDHIVADKAYSDDTAQMIDEEIRRFAAEAYQDAERMLTEHWDATVAVAEALLKHETLTAEEVRRLMRGEPLGKPSVSDLLEAESKRLAQEQAAMEKPAPQESTGADEDFGGAMPAPA